MSNWRADPSQPTAEHMICQLAGMCDGASSLDGAGFSRMDVNFGHSLASQASSGRAWSDKQASAALKLINKYQRQLGGPDFIKSWLKNPNFVHLPVCKSTQEGQNAGSRQPQVFRKLSSRDKTAVFSFSYDPNIVSEIKKIQGQHKGTRFRAQYDAATRTWSVDVNESSISAIMGVAEQFKFEIEPRFVIFWEKVQAKTQESRMMLALNDGINVLVADDAIQIAIDNAEILNEFKHALKVG